MAVVHHLVATAPEAERGGAEEGVQERLVGLVQLVWTSNHTLSLIHLVVGKVMTISSRSTTVAAVSYDSFAKAIMLFDHVWEPAQASQIVRFSALKRPSIVICLKVQRGRDYLGLPTMGRHVINMRFLATPDKITQY